METLKMDSSNRVPYILGDNIRVDTSEMTTKDWLAVIERILKFNKPHLKYLSNFEEIEKFMNGDEFPSRRMPVSGMSSDAKIKFDEGITLTTRCIFICKLKVELSKGMPTSKPFVRLHNEVHCILAEILLFSNKGDFIVWHAGYIRSLKDGCEKPKTNDDIITTMAHSFFSTIDNEELATLINRHPHIGKEFIKMLSLTTAQSVLRQRKRLEKSEIMERELRAIEERLG
jgi:hypothetical protein